MEKTAYANKYMVLFTVTLGTMLSGYVSSSINIALPNIIQTFGFTMDSVVWVSLAYMLPYGATLPIMGKLGDQFGRKKMFLTGLTIFTAATLLVGLAWNSTILILFRILQGLGAGLLFPNSMALVADAFPPSERGQALGMWGAFAAAGSTLGPTIGGYIVEYMEWRLLFYSILPIALLALLLGSRVLEESKNDDSAAKIDYIGGFLLVFSLSCLLLALNQGSKEGWTSAYIVGLIFSTVVSMGAFLYMESHIKNPLVDLQLFTNVTFTVSNLVGFLSFLAMFGGLFLLPFYLRNILGYSAIKAGIALLPLMGSMVVLAPLGGRLADHFGSRIPASIGMAVMAAALFSFRLLDDQTPYWHIAIGLIIMGAGLAFTMSPLSNGVMGTLPKDKIGVGSGVFNLFKNIGGSVGVAIMGTLLNNRQIFHTAVSTNYIHGASEQATQLVAALQGGFAQQGFAAAEAKMAALTVVQGLVTKQAAVAAFDDVFLITAVLCAVGIIPALFIRDPKNNKQSDPAVSDKQADLIPVSS
ncbi:DHA2 family efflux MFS transporter permease subunit [Anaerospora hongkongensis]|uniref:DHA2 family efflux MFS transporter permease subunit n=1 Tax=Anaerospora hongkongensis TaxID=244830 RepID=UPI0028984049|nr:DHA2 family efflux MFS transporter permease subunit [Anaerospora hongkongensis]